MHSQFRESIENFDYQQAGELYPDLIQMVEDDVFNDDRVVLEGYLHSLSKVPQEGIQPFQQFLKTVPQDYTGFLNEQIWKDYNALYHQKN